MTTFFRFIAPAAIALAAAGCNNGLIETGTDGDSGNLAVEISGQRTFPAAGGTLTLRIVTRPGGKTAQKDDRPIIPDSITARTESDLFRVVSIRTGETATLVEVEAGENGSAEPVGDHLSIRVSYKGETVSQRIKIFQLASAKSYRRNIDCDIESPFHIPAEGGKFGIHLKSTILHYVDGIHTETVPGDLRGLYIQQVEENTGYVHSFKLDPQADDPGSYLFTYSAEGPYNLNSHWAGGGNGYIETDSFVRIYDPHDDKDLLRIDFIHPQTPGKRCCFPYSSSYYTAPLNI